MTNEDNLYADKLRNKALSDYARLNLAINELEKTEQVHTSMTREQAINYLKSSGMSDEQIKSVIDAFTCDDCISRTELLTKIDEERKHLLAIKMDGAEHIIVHHARRIIEDMPTVMSKEGWIPVSERLPEKSGKYLVTVKNGNVYAGTYDAFSGKFQCAATAWQPLPDPYKVESEDN